MKQILSDSWFQLCALLAVVSFSIFVYNDVECHAYTGGTRCESSGAAAPASTRVMPGSIVPPVLVGASRTPPNVLFGKWKGTVTNAGTATTPVATASLSVGFSILGKKGTVAFGPELTGGGPFTWTALGDSIIVTSTSPAGDVIRFAGVMSDSQMVGVYTITAGQAAGQLGIWNVMRAGPKVTLGRPLGTPATVGRPLIPRSVTIGAPLATANVAASTALKASAVRSPVAGDLHSIAFANAGAGVIVGKAGTILATSDGGVTWVKRFYSGGDLFGVSQLPGGTAVAVGPGGIVLRSELGTLVWRGVPSGTTKMLSEVRFADAQVGVAVGASATLVRTVDGGQSWRVVPLTAAGTMGLVTAAFSGGSTAVAVGERSAIIRSTDRGATWAYVPAPGESAELSINGVVWLHGSTWVAAGGNCATYRSTDDGRTWTRRNCAAVAHLNTLATVSPAMLAAAGTPAATPLVVGVGTGGTIVVSGDEGITWRAVPSGTTEDLISVAFRTPAEAIAVGAKGTMLRIHP